MLKLKHTFVALSFLSTILTSSAFAADSDFKTEWHFYGDAYYSHNFNKPAALPAASATSVSSASLPDAKNVYRYHDIYPNQFNLNLLEASMLVKSEEVSFLADLDFGTFADLNTAAGSVSGSSRTVDEVSKHIGQAVLTYRPAGSRFSFDIGKMYTHVGLETAKPKDNFNYSRSILFSYGIPLWHVGMRAGYDLMPEKLQLNLYLYNAWNSFYDNNHSKTFGAQLKFTPSANVLLAYNYISGAERTDSQRDKKTVHNLVTSWGFMDRWTLATDWIYGEEEGVIINSRRSKPVWYAGQAAIKWACSDRTYVSPRYEVYRDQHGHTLSNGPHTLKTATLTVGHMLSKGLELRAEGRWDTSNRRPFTKGLKTAKEQNTGLVGLFVYFSRSFEKKGARPVWPAPFFITQILLSVRVQALERSL